MKNFSFLLKTLCGVSVMVVSFFVAGCNFTSSNSHPVEADTISVTETDTDSTIYGTCGESTAMHSLELVTDTGDTLQYIIGEDAEGNQDVQGGLLVGDRLAVIEGMGADGEKEARKVLNLTTLLGKWISLDKNFEILEGGTVKSHLKAEANPWVRWKILNGQLLLNTDTFNVIKLGKDSLYLENAHGIFTYKRP